MSEGKFIPPLPVAATPDCEIVSSRTVPFSRELVFRAWTEPQHLQVWWGPEGFTNTFNEFDPRPGGHWKFVMHGPGGKGNYVNECVFTHVQIPGLIAWTRISQPHFSVLATFSETTHLQTSIIFRMIFDSAEACGKVSPFAVTKNEENFDRLEEELKRMTHS